MRTNRASRGDLWRRRRAGARYHPVMVTMASLCSSGRSGSVAAAQIQRELARLEREERDHHRVRIGGAAGEPVGA